MTAIVPYHAPPNVGTEYIDWTTIPVDGAGSLGLVSALPALPRLRAAKVRIRPETPSLALVQILMNIRALIPHRFQFSITLVNGACLDR